MASKTFNVVMRDCIRDIGVYFGNHYWFMSGYTPISSYNKIASAQINCQNDELCPSGEYHDIDVGKTIRYNIGYDVKCNKVVPGYPDAYANITVTEVYIDPCLGVICEPFCDEDYNYYRSECDSETGQCVDTLIEEQSVQHCGYEEPCIPNWQCRIPLDSYETDINNCGELDRYNENCEPVNLCEGIICNPICIGYDLYSQTCTEGECITDQLIEYNSLDCEYIEPEPPTEPNNIIFYGAIGLATLIGLKLLTKK